MGKNKEHKVNIKARISRHSRMLKENITLKNKIFNNFKKNNILYKSIVFLLIFTIPIYPMFAGLIYNSNEYDFYRGYIDEDSILGAYELDDSIISNSDSEENQEFITDSSILEDSRDYSGTKEIKKYIVRAGDSISIIANKFNVSKNTIYDFNNFSKNHIIKPGEELSIPATSGIKYKVKKGDSLLAISKKYKIDKDKILEFNQELNKRSLKPGEVIFLAGAKKIYEKPKIIQKTYTSRKTYTKKTNYVAGNYTNQKGVYKLKWHKPFSGVWGNCTYYVASYKKVDWRGNANQWLENASKKGHKVVYGRGFAPELGSIIVFAGRGYNLRYGHVGIVMELKKEYMIVSDMNYRRLNEVTYRKVYYNDKRIMGYIYID